jgi:hypothetical protein
MKKALLTTLVLLLLSFAAHLHHNLIAYKATYSLVQAIVHEEKGLASPLAY